MPLTDEKYMELLTQRTGLLKEVLELTRLQPALLEGEDDTDGLLTNISDRQRLVDRLNRIKDELDASGSAGGPAFSAMQKEAEALLSEIQKQDKINEKLALGRMAELREKLKKGRDGRTAIRGYDQTGDVGAVYFNKLK